MRQELDTPPEERARDEADRVSRDLPGQVRRARWRLLGEYRSILREEPSEDDR